MENIKISEHPNLMGVVREVRVLDVVVSYANRNASLFLAIEHFVGDKLWTKVIANGTILKSFKTGFVQPNGFPCEETDDGAINEFDFLFSLLDGEGESRRLFNQLIESIIVRNDNMGLFNDYNS